MTMASATVAGLWLDRLAMPWRDLPDDALAESLPELDPTLRARLLACARTAPRLAARLFPLAAPDALAPSHPLLLDADELAELVQIAGAIRHAPAVLRVIERAPRERLITAIGPRAYAAAIRHRGLGRPELLPADDLLALIPAAGLGCLLAWADGLEPGLAQRLRLRLSKVDAAPEPVEAAQAAAIVAAALSDLAADG